jgi:hypothetical protein
MGKALSWRVVAFQGAEWRVPTGRRDGAELVGTDGHGSLGELGHGERARGKVELGKKGAAGLCCPWSNEQGARARRTGRALGWRLKTTKKCCSQGKRHGREVDELLGDGSGCSLPLGKKGAAEGGEAKGESRTPPSRSMGKTTDCGEEGPCCIGVALRKKGLLVSMGGQALVKTATGKEEDGVGKNAGGAMGAARQRDSLRHEQERRGLCVWERRKKRVAAGNFLGVGVENFQVSTPIYRRWLGLGFP